MLNITVGIPDLDPAVSEIEGEIAARATDAMRGATGVLKETLRGQVVSAGMGQRLANTWRTETYPSNANALEPVAWAWSNAPAIIDGFARGVTIQRQDGKGYLWLPSKAVPRARGGGRTTSTKKMTPEQVLAEFGAKDFVILKGKRGNLEAFLPVDRGVTPRGNVRKARRGRLAHGSTQELVLMFTLVSSVTLPQDLDLDGAANHAGDDFVARLSSSG